MIGRCMYIWKLQPVVGAEGGINRLVDKAREPSFHRFGLRSPMALRPTAM